jgi:hypothetical protein
MYRNKLNEIEQKLQTAYDILSKAQTDVMTDTDEAFIAIEEASGFVAEALEMLRERV